MLITTILGAFVASTQWNWSRLAVAAVFVPMLLMDCVFVAGNMTKLPTGGWIPLALSAVLFVVFWTWRSGRIELRAALAKLAVPKSELAKLIAGAHRVPGTGVFLASDPGLVPSALIRNIEHNRVVHERVIILNVEFARYAPASDPVRRVRIEEMLAGCIPVTARFGFMETPDVGQALKACRTRGLRVFTEDSSFFVGRHVVRARPIPGLEGPAAAAVRPHAAATARRPRSSSACRSGASSCSIRPSRSDDSCARTLFGHKTGFIREAIL